MKYKRPKDICWMNVDLKEFLDSIPDEFEIVPDGYSCVKWPEWFTRERLLILAERGGVCERDGALRALAAIAPKRKRRRVAVWIGRDGNPYCAPADENHGIAADSTIIDL